MRPSMLRHIRPNLNVSKANVITSMWKEYEKNEKHFFNWVDSKGYEKTLIHTSGHADMLSLKIIADYINPKVIIPIHTLQKEYFKTIFNQKIRLLEDNESYEL
jgi:ribonuclease J